VVTDNLRLDAQEFSSKVYYCVLHGFESTAGIVRLDNLSAKGFIRVGLPTLNVSNTHNLVNLTLNLIHCLIRHLQGIGDRGNIHKVNSTHHSTLFTEGSIVFDRNQGIVFTLGEQTGKTWLGCIVNTTDFQGVNEAIDTVCKCV